MTWESIALGALCVSQGLMWIRNVQVMRKAWKNQAAFENAHLAKIDEAAANADAFMNEAITELKESTQQQIGWLEGISNDLNLALQRLPKKRNVRTRTAKPLEASSDPVGPVAS